MNYTREYLLGKKYKVNNTGNENIYSIHPYPLGWGKGTNRLMVKWTEKETSYSSLFMVDALINEIQRGNITLLGGKNKERNKIYR